MIKVPQVIGLVLCETMEVDLHAGRTSLIGIFHALHFPTFPTPPQTLTAYFALYGGEGEGTIELVLQRTETEEDVHRYRKWLTFPGQRMTLNQEIRLTHCVFPAPGRYSLRLRFDDRELSLRFLDIYQD